MFDNLNPTVWLTRLILALCFLFAGVLLGWKLSSDHYAAKQEKAAIKVVEVVQKQGEVALSIADKYATKLKTNDAKSSVIQKEIHNEISADIVLPARYRLLHDTAASNALPDTASLTNAQPVTAQDLADTIAENYAACIDRGDQIKALQDFIEMERLVVLK